MYNVNTKATVSVKETVDEILSYPIRAIPERGLTKETCEHFGVRVSLSEEDGKTITAIYYPYTSKGKITGFKKKDLTIPKGERLHFTIIGDVNINCDLFGTNVGQTGGKKVFITEGENDAMAAYQVLKKKYPAGNPTVLSIGFGTANAAQHIGNNLKYLQNFSEVVVSFDMDESTEAERKKGVKKGKEAVQDVAKLIQDIKVVELSEKDANDMVLAGKEDELYWALVSKAKTYVPEKIKFGGDLSVDELMEPLKEGVYVNCFPKLMEMIHGFREAELTVFLAPAGVGKCLGKGTLVRMYDGSLKKVEDIVVGDKVMGPDSCERIVTSTVSGVDTLYQVTQTNGDPYIVNSAHILSLKASYSDGAAVKGNILNQNVVEYLKSSPNHKKIWSGYRVGYDLANAVKPEIDAYLIGLWLAEGNSDDGKVWINNADVEIIEYLKSNFNIGHVSEGRGCKGYYIRGLQTILRKYGILGDKKVPEIAFQWSLEDRKKLLAGVFDGDGSITNGGIEITQKNQDLFNGIVDLAETVGLRVSRGKVKIIDGVEYYRGILKCNENDLPLILKRKVGTRRTDASLSKLSIKEVGIGEYYGFTLSGNDRLFLLKDGTVTHNTTVIKEIGYSLVKSGAFVGHIFLEEDLKKTLQSYIALDNNVLLPSFRQNPNILSREAVEKSRENLLANGRTIFLSHFGSIANSSLMDKMRYMAAAGAQYIILDHLSMVISGQETDNERRLIDNLLTELAAFVTATGVHVIAVAHIRRNDFQPPRNKDTKEVEYPYWVPVKKEDARGSGAFEQLAFNVITIEPEIIDEAGTRGRIRLRVQKSREWGETGLADIVIMDRNTGRLVDADKQISF